MNLTTSKGKTYSVAWMWGPLMSSGEVMMEMEDARALSEIAAELEGLDKMTYTDTYGREKVYEGYTDLRAIIRQGATGRVQVTWRQGREAGA